MMQNLRRVWGERLYELGAFLVVTLLILLLWQAIYSFEVVSNLVLPSPYQAFEQLFSGLFSSTLYWSHIWVTAKESILAFIIGGVLAVIAGAAFAFVPIVKKAFYPYVIIGASFPMIAIAPLFVLWFGYGLSSKVAIGASIAAFPILVATHAGLTSIDPQEAELFRSLKATFAQELKHLRVPRAYAYVVPTLDVAILGALLGCIAGEFVAAKQGVGFLVQQYSQIGDAKSVFAVLFCIAGVGLTMRGIMRLLARLGPQDMY